MLNITPKKRKLEKTAKNDDDIEEEKENIKKRKIDDLIEKEKEYEFFFMNHFGEDGIKTTFIFPSSMKTKIPKFSFPTKFHVYDLIYRTKDLKSIQELGKIISSFVGCDSCDSCDLCCYDLMNEKKEVRDNILQFFEQFVKKEIPNEASLFEKINYYLSNLEL